MKCLDLAGICLKEMGELKSDISNSFEQLDRCERPDNFFIEESESVFSKYRQCHMHIPYEGIVFCTKVYLQALSLCEKMVEEGYVNIKDADKLMGLSSLIEETYKDNTETLLKDLKKASKLLKKQIKKFRNQNC